MRIKAILPLLLLSVPALSQAQSLDECLRYAEEHSLRLRQAELSAEKARTLEKTAFQMSRTGLSLSQDPTSGGSPDNALTLSQEFDFPTVYAGRRKLLRAAAEVEESQLALTGSELRRDVSSAYCTLVLRQRICELLRKNAADAEEFLRIAEARFSAGACRRTEVLSAAQVKAENEIRLREAENAQREAGLALKLLLGTEEDIIPTDSDTPVSESRQEFCFSVTPEGLLSQRELELSRRNLSLASQEGFLPTFSLGVRHQLVIGGINPYGVDRSRFEGGNWMGFEAGLSVPIFFGAQRRKVAAARLDVEMASVQLAQRQREADAALSKAAGKLSAARDTYAYYTSEALPQARELRSLSSVEYALGHISYMEYMQNLSTALQTELDGALSADALNQAVIEMNFIKGN